MYYNYILAFPYQSFNNNLDSNLNDKPVKTSIRKSQNLIDLKTKVLI